MHARSLSLDKLNNCTGLTPSLNSSGICRVSCKDNGGSDALVKERPCCRYSTSCIEQNPSGLSRCRRGCVSSVKARRVGECSPRSNDHRLRICADIMSISSRLWPRNPLARSVSRDAASIKAHRSLHNTERSTCHPLTKVWSKLISHLSSASAERNLKTCRTKALYARASHQRVRVLNGYNDARYTSINYLLCAGRSAPLVITRLERYNEHSIACQLPGLK